MSLLRRLFSSSTTPPSHNNSSSTSTLNTTTTMGNCHSSQDKRNVINAQPRSLSPKSPHVGVQGSQPYQQSQHTTTPSSHDIWSPPPYTSVTSTTTPVSPSASASASGPSTFNPNDTAYSFLSTFDTVFLVDDSTSMRGKRWREAEDAIAAIAPICTHYDADGIDIYFLNHRNQSSFGGAGSGNAGGYKNVTDASGVREVFKSVYPSGATPVGTRLYQILNPYLREVSKLTAKGRESELKPLNIIVITDGVFTDDAESVVVGVARQLDHPSVQAVPWQIGIQFFQVGDDEPAREYLQALDDELVRRRSYDGIRDIVDTVPWRGDRGRVLNAEGILKCVLGAVNKRYDKKEATR